MTKSPSLFAVALALFFGFQASLLSAKTSSAGVESKIALEESLERRLKSVISQILGSNDVIVIVKAEMYTQTEQRSPETDEDSMALPGVPIKESVGERDTLASLDMGETQTHVKKLSATLVLDSAVSESDVNVIKNVTTGLLGLRDERGDKLEIQRMDFHRGQKKGFNWKRLLTPPDLWWTMGLSLLFVFILLITLFFFGSFRIFIREFVRALRNYGESVEEQIKLMQMQKRSQEELSGREAETEVKELEKVLTKSPRNSAAAAVAENGKDGPPFSFLNETHLQNLKFLLRREKPEQIAIIVNFLQAGMANEIVSSLDPALQAQVLSYLTKVADMDPQVVRAVESKIRERVAFVIGGEERLQVLLDEADPAAQKAMLDHLTQNDPALAGRLRQKMFVLEDLAKLDATTLAAIVRRTNTRTLAGVLRETSPELQEKVLAALPPGSGNMLREEISLARPLPPQKLAQEQKRIIQHIRRLNDEGVIQINREATA